MKDLVAATWEKHKDALSDGSLVYAVWVRNADGDLLCKIDCEDERQADALLRNLHRAAV